MKYVLNRKVPPFYKQLRVEHLLVKAFNGKPVRSEREITQSLSRFPNCKSKDEAKSFLDFGVKMDLVKPIKKNRRRLYEL